MFKKTIKYADYDGNEKERSFYFNLTRPELMEMKRSPLFEMQKLLDRIQTMDDPDEELTYAEKDEIQGKMGEILRNLVVQSYGVRSDDGERFIKRVDNRRFGAGEDFVETMAYDYLYMEMISDIKNLIDFVRAIVPADVQAEIDTAPELAELREKVELDNVTPLSSE